MPALLNRLALRLTRAVVVAGLLAGCGGNSSSTSAGGVSVTPVSEVVAESDTKEANAPPVTKTLVSE